VRYLLAAVIAAFIGVPALAQTQPTRPSAYPTIQTMPSAFATSALSPCYPSFRHHRRGYFNRTSPCYSGTVYPVYSAVAPSEIPPGASFRAALSEGANGLNGAQAKQRIEAKGYSKLSGLHKDSRGIWRGDAILKDGRPVEVVLDLDGNIYSQLVPRVNIWIRPRR